MLYLDYLKEHFTTPSAAFHHLDMKSYLDNQIYFSKKFQANHPLLVEQINHIQEEFQILFDTYFNVGSDYFKHPTLYQNEIVNKVKNILNTDDSQEELNQAIHSMLSLDLMQQKILALASTYDSSLKYTWKDVNNFITMLQVQKGPFIEYDIKWQDYVDTYDLTFLTINQVYDQVALSDTLVKQMNNIQKSLNLSNKHIGQGKLGLTINHVHQYEAVFYPYDFMAIKFKNLNCIENFLGHEWMHFIDRLMGMSLVEAKILPKNTMNVEMTSLSDHKLSLLKMEKLNILYPNIIELIDSFQKSKHLNLSNLDNFQDFAQDYFKKFNLTQFVKKLQKFHILKPIKNLDDKIQFFLNDEDLYQKKFHSFLAKCFEKDYQVDNYGFLYAQFDTLMYLKKTSKQEKILQNTEIDINLFYYYARQCDYHLTQMNSTFYPSNYATSPLEMLARSFETFLIDETNEKNEFEPYFARPKGLEKMDFAKKWKKIGQEIKKTHIIMNSHEYQHLKNQPLQNTQTKIKKA